MPIGEKMVFYKKYSPIDYEESMSYSKAHDFITNANEFPLAMFSETKTAYYIRILLPSLDTEHFTLKMKENQLIIQGKFCLGKCRFIHKERPLREFYRKFTFDQCIDKNNIESELTNGVLFMMLPKESSKEIILSPTTSQHEK